MSKKYKQPVLERRTKAHDPYVKTNYKDTIYQRPEPKPIMETAPIIYFNEWFKTLAIMLIPFVNLIVAVVWGTNKKIKINEIKRNWAKACIPVLIIFYLIVGGIVALILLLKK